MDQKIVYEINDEDTLFNARVPLIPGIDDMNIDDVNMYFNTEADEFSFDDEFIYLTIYNG